MAVKQREARLVGDQIDGGAPKCANDHRILHDASTRLAVELDKLEQGILCGKAFPCSLLVVAHIKPRAACTDCERRDFRNNVAPMCLFGCDALFERRVVVVTDGKVRVRRAFFTHGCPSLLDEIEDRAVTFCTPQREKYFQWHASQVLGSRPPTSFESSEGPAS
jgi:hypothetical protein